MTNHYEALEVSERASLAVINAAWLVLMKRYHPDGTEPDEEKARLVNNAHDVLENPEARRKFDLNIAQERNAELRQQQVAWEPQQQAGPMGAYPSAYPADILQMAAMRMGSTILNTFLSQSPELSFLINTALKRGGKA